MLDGFFWWYRSEAWLGAQVGSTGWGAGGIKSSLHADCNACMPSNTFGYE